MKLQFLEVAILSDFAVHGFTCVCVFGILEFIVSGAWLGMLIRI